MNYQAQKDAITDKVAGVANDTVEGVSRAADRLQREGASLQNSLANKASDLSDKVSTSLKNVGVDTDDVKAAMGDALDALGANIRQVVKNRPMGALAIAAGLGLLFGLMSTR